MSARKKTVTKPATCRETAVSMMPFRSRASCAVSVGPPPREAPIVSRERESLAPFASELKIEKRVGGLRPHEHERGGENGEGRRRARRRQAGGERPSVRHAPDDDRRE